MSNLLSIKFWFNLRPGLLTPVFAKTLTGLIIFFLVSGIVFYLINRSKKYNLYSPIWTSLSAFGFTNFAIGLVVWFFNYELIPLLSARFWFLLWGAGILAWAIMIYLMLPKIRAKKEQAKEKQEYKKYIP